MKKKLKILIITIIALNTAIKSFDKYVYENTPMLINKYGDPYQVSFFSIEETPTKLFNAIPKTLLESLLKELNIKTAQELLNNFKSNNEKQKINLDFYITFWKKPFNKETKSYEWKEEHPYNLIFHELAGKWTNQTQPFNVNVPMGIFDPNGVEGVKAGVPFDKFEPIAQYKHDDAYSPDNAHFNIKKNQNIASFWASAFSPDKKNVFVSFNILFNPGNKETKELTETIIQAAQSKSLSYIIKAMEKNSETLKNKDDKTALDYAIKTFTQIENLPSKLIVLPTTKGLTIFGKGGYLELVSAYNKLLSFIRDDLSKSINSDYNIDQARNILFNIGSAVNDIENLTPLRAFLAANEFYPNVQNKIYLDIKNKKNAPGYFLKSLEEKFTQLDNMETTSKKLQRPKEITLKMIKDKIQQIYNVSQNKKDLIPELKDDIIILRNFTKFLSEKTDSQKMNEIYDFAIRIEKILKIDNAKAQIAAMEEYQKSKNKKTLMDILNVT